MGLTIVNFVRVICYKGPQSLFDRLGAAAGHCHWEDLGSLITDNAYSKFKPWSITLIIHRCDGPFFYSKIILCILVVVILRSKPSFHNTVICFEIWNFEREYYNSQKRFLFHFHIFKISSSTTPQCRMYRQAYIPKIVAIAGCCFFFSDRPSSFSGITTRRIRTVGSSIRRSTSFE